MILCRQLDVNSQESQRYTWGSKIVPAKCLDPAIFSYNPTPLGVGFLVFEQ